MSEIQAGGLSSDLSGDRVARLLRPILHASSRSIVAWALALVAFIALVDMKVHLNSSLGFLYLVPIMLGALKMDRWQVLLLTLGCAVLREVFGDIGTVAPSASNVPLVFISFMFTGLLAHEIAQAQLRAEKNLVELREQIELRREAEGQLRSLVESSPAAILTLDSAGKVEIANRAARALLAAREPGLEGRWIGDFLPPLADLINSPKGALEYRSVMNCRGHRDDGELFMASTWFASYPTRSGPRFAIILADYSEDLRDSQEASLQSLLRNSRLVVGSVAHEIRNFCAAIQMLHTNLGRVSGVAETEDYRALGSLAEGLSRMATMEMQSAEELAPGSVDVGGVLDELKVVLAPSCSDLGIELAWNLPEERPVVVGEHYTLLQVFLNLTRNSQRVLDNSRQKRIEISMEILPDAVFMRFRDSGPGITNSDKLFHAFQPGADNTGLGLFVSRALVRACEGELYHEAGPTGCTMVVRLTPISESEALGTDAMTETNA